jgi:RimJ/RimL family protein N-acetyltransferase
MREDFATILAWFPDEAALVQWGGADVRFPLDAPQLERPLEESMRRPPARLLWAGELDTGVVAHASVALDWRHGVARLARVCVAPAYRGRGLAVPFLSQIRDNVFGMPEFERLELNVYTFNHAAIRSYRRLGFVEEGVRRSSVRVGQERWDTAIYGLLRSGSPSRDKGSGDDFAKTTCDDRNHRR